MWDFDSQINSHRQKARIKSIEFILGFWWWLKILKSKAYLPKHVDLPNLKHVYSGMVLTTGFSWPSLSFSVDESIVFFFLRKTIAQLLSHVWLFATPWTTARRASLSFTTSLCLLKLKSIESVMPSNHLIFCCPLFLLPSVFCNIRVFSHESSFCIRGQKFWQNELRHMRLDETHNVIKNVSSRQFW